MARSRPGTGTLILVVDGDRLIRTIAREALENEGFAVAEAGDGAEALIVCQELDPGVVLLDLSGDDADAIEFCRNLRERESDGEAATPVLVMASDQRVEPIREALDAGASDFVPKPIRWPLLGTRVRFLLRNSGDVGSARRGVASYEKAQKIAGVGSWEWRPATKDMLWSDVTYEILGFDAHVDRASYERFWDSVHADDRASAREQTEEAFFAEEVFALQHRIVHPQGEVRYVQLRGEWLSGSDGEDPWVAGTIQDITEQRNAEDQIRYMANYDGLTGLVNRRYFNERLEAAIEHADADGSMLALLYVDLDRFKRLNDTLGHSVGDRVLQIVAERLNEYVRRTDTVGRFCVEESEPADFDTAVSRLGGDEFSVLLPRVSDASSAEEVAARLLAELGAPIVVEGHEVTTTASIGIALYPGDGEAANALLQHSDRAMYAAKQAGRNLYRTYTASMDASSHRRFGLERQLRGAIEREELNLYYQPKVDLKTGRVVGMEALLRWTNDEFGVVSPTEFISVCEETGLILPIGEWAMRTACRQNRAWQEAGFEPLRVAVNVSIVQFQRQNIGSTVAAILQECELDPSLLEIEITESVMLQDAEAIAVVLRDLRHMGVGVALDDFGTGYSSLSFISNFPLDSLKMDRSFVRNVDSDNSAAAIAQAVIAMAHGLELQVVAEGVDLDAQADFLREQGCDQMQGFLISGAVAAEDFEQFLVPVEAESPDDD